MVGFTFPNFSHAVKFVKPDVTTMWNLWFQVLENFQTDLADCVLNVLFSGLSNTAKVKSQQNAAPHSVLVSVLSTTLWNTQIFQTQYFCRKPVSELARFPELQKKEIIWNVAVIIEDIKVNVTY